MYKYYITKGDLGYHVFREKEVEGIKVKERLQNNSYTLNVRFAKTFYHLSEATSALSIARVKGEKIKLGFGIEKKESEKKSEKTSWSEL